MTLQTPSSNPITLAGAPMGDVLHACAFFNSDVEGYRVLTPFIREGIEAGEKAFHIVSAAGCDHHLGHLRDADIAIDAARERGQLDLHTWDEIYFADGTFDYQRVLETMLAHMTQAHDEGYARTRLVSRMDWALEDYPGTQDLLEYETRFNLEPNPGNPVVCVYDLAKFRADVIIDVMRVHPIMVIGETLQENPFFVPPEQMLAELRAR